MPNHSKRRAAATRKQKEANKYDNLDSLTLLDVRCTVCMGIFIEPVTIPCDHTVCRLCFERTIDNNSLSCPLCRKYIGGWIRQRQKKGLLVNKILWSHIQTHFQTHVQKKLSGEDDEEIDSLAEQQTPVQKLSEPGAIRLEYEAEQKRIQQESLQRQEKEAQASEQLIKELQEQENKERQKLEELRRKAEEEDALVAKKIAEQLLQEQARKEAEEEENLRRMLEEEATSAFVRLPPSHAIKKGPMDAFLSSCDKPNRTESSSSTDSLRTEMCHFKPVEVAPKTPPKKTRDGKVVAVTPIRVPVMRALSLPAGSSKEPSPPLSSGASTLRPWIQKTSASGDSNSSSSRESVRQKRHRTPDDVIKSPKRTRRESPKKKLPLFSSPEEIPRASGSGLSHLSANSAHTLNGYSSSVSFDLKKRGTSQSFDSETDFEEDEACDRSLRTTHKKVFRLKSSLCDSASELDSVTSSSLDLKGSVDSIPLLSLADQALAEERLSQEQADYELALKLQNELNAEQFVSRSYQLRSVDQLSPRKNQQKVTPPRSKLKQKTPSSSSKKDRRRQCTLEEAMSFSVKMQLQGSLK